MPLTFTRRFQEATRLAGQFAVQHKEPELRGIHLFVAIMKLDGVAADAVQAVGMSPSLLSGVQLPREEASGVSAGISAKSIIESAIAEAHANGDSHVSTGHLLLSLVVRDPEVHSVLDQHDADSDGLRRSIRDQLADGSCGVRESQRGST